MLMAVAPKANAERNEEKYMEAILTASATTDVEAVLFRVRSIALVS